MPATALPVNTASFRSRSACERTPMTSTDTAPDPRHGTVAGYNRIPCRQLCCRTAYARWRKGRNHDANHGRLRILPSLGSQRRIQALTALGWSTHQLAAATGIPRLSLSRVLNQDTISRRLAAQIDRAYRRLGMQLPPQRTPAEKRAATISRERAASNGWVPPLAWDDIDDDDATPNLGVVDLELVDEVLVHRALRRIPVKATKPERLEIIRRWQQNGRSLAELDRVQGWNTHRDLREDAA